MRVCIISKFPPIQGGISSKTYWLARGLAEKGVVVHVVTNADCVEKEYRIEDGAPEQSPNVTVHNIIPDIPWHIPNSELYVPRLLDKALEVVGKNKIDVIDTNYLIPYGIVGYIVSTITGIPYVLRHGGSDLAKFMQAGVFKNLLERVIRNATTVITDEKNKALFEGINPNIAILPRYIPNEQYFHPFPVSHKTPTFAYIGKINHYWKYKSLDKIVDIFSGIKEDHKLILVGQGKGILDFQQYVDRQGLKNHEFKKFVHPVQMPHLLGNIDYLLYFEKNNPIKDFSNIVCEALWSGIPVITDETFDLTDYTKFINVVQEEQILSLDLDDTKSAQSQINMIIRKFSGSSRCPVTINYSFDRYIEENLKIYGSVYCSRERAS